MKIKRVQYALESLLGIGRRRWRTLGDGLFVLNLHRIGDRNSTLFDPNVFSCSTAMLEQHLRFLLDHFTAIGLPELLDSVHNGRKITGRRLLVTFDDGYRDNYLAAYPILQGMKIPAVFFIATSLVETNELPWWDKIAYLIHCSNIGAIRLPYWKKEIRNTGEQRLFIRCILTQVKQCAVSATQQTRDIEAFVGTTQAYPALPFLTWNDIRQMSDNGMEFGAHSHNHEILSKLNGKEVRYELSHSKNLLESHLDKPVVAFSYPVGKAASYNERVINALKDCGYQIAFNFLPGINTDPINNRFELRRFPIDYDMDVNDLKRMLSCTAEY